MSEEQYRNKIDPILHNYFHVDTEVWSTDGKKRIDYVLKCKESGALFGLEVKRKIIHRGAEIGRYLIQANEYSNKKFISKFDTMQIPIFISPAISDIYKEVKPDTIEVIGHAEKYEVFHKSDSKHSNINSMIGIFNVGEIRKFEYKHNIYGFKWFSFIFRNMEIWRSKNNYNNPRLNENNYEKMMQLIKK